MSDFMGLRLSNIIDQIRATGCDAPNPGVYTDSEGNYHCRCVVCARCRKHTGNSNQGHYWVFCRVLAKANPNMKLDDCLVEFHFCCPGDCELYNSDGTRK